MAKSRPILTPDSAEKVIHVEKVSPFKSIWTDTGAFYLSTVKLILEGEDIVLYKIELASS